MTTLTLNADQPGPTISRHIYGHFAEHLGRCIYEGLWVGEDSPIPNTRGFRNDVVNALRQLDMPNLRWPGGCFADTYHWTDGIGPREHRNSIVNIHWGGVTENNHVGTHEFFDLCQQLSTDTNLCEPYVCGNVGSGTVREMSEWVDYITHKPGNSPMADLRKKNGRDEPWHVKYWAVGNENWGCGGHMRPQFYADLYRQYAGYLRPGNGEKLYKVACGLTEEWNQVVIENCHGMMDGLSIHHYSHEKDFAHKGHATDFGPEGWTGTLHVAHRVDGFLKRTAGQLDRYDPKGRIGIILDEWGTWFDPMAGTNPGFLYQESTIRDAVVAAHSFHIFHDHAERLHMANIAQTVNVLQAMVLTDGPRMALTPTYHVFEMFKPHQNARRLPLHIATPTYADDGQQKLPMVSASASTHDLGIAFLTLTNLHPTDATEVTIDVRGAGFTQATGRVLTSPTLQAVNNFNQPDVIRPQPFTDFTFGKTGLTLKLPAASVVALELS